MKFLQYALATFILFCAVSGLTAYLELLGSLRASNPTLGWGLSFVGAVPVFATSLFIHMTAWNVVVPFLANPVGTEDFDGDSK